ncbi:MAG: hypothetical protein K2Y23_04155 [Cyanobacteria bacterium]|nr:hypothetical protein [Cyanobacteriota bacterium]
MRVTHWLIALSIGVLTITGFYIGRPFVTVPGPAALQHHRSAPVRSRQHVDEAFHDVRGLRR